MLSDKNITALQLSRFHEFTVGDYLNAEFPCSCKRVHQVPVRQVIVEAAALKRLPEVIAQAGRHKPFLLYDSTTYPIAGRITEDILTAAGVDFTHYILEEASPVPDEKAVGSVLMHCGSSCDLIIAVGSGTLNDICRFISYQLKLPYIIAATAPSMDGFASTVAPLIVNHMKTTYEAHAPYAILGDLDLLAAAPKHMIAAGIGDILGKYTSLCDWAIAHLLLGEYHCETIEGMVRRSIKTVLLSTEAAKTGEPRAIRDVMEALVLSGIAMSFAGNSRPASGSEHHIAHYWEMKFLSQGKKPTLHGTEVGIATIAVLKAYELLRERVIDFTAAREKAPHYSEVKWEADMIRTYGPAAPSVLRLEKELGKNSPEKVLARLEQSEKHWEEILALSFALPTADRIRDIIRSFGAPSSPAEIGIDRDTFIDSFLVAKELRNRYGLLQLLFDLGLCRELALRVWDYFKER